MATPAEQWLPVVGYDGYYSVSNLGRVRSESRTVMDKNGNRRRLPQKILKPDKKPSGHLVVSLWRNRNREKPYVHRLVLEAFVGEAPPGTQACHWNDDKEDNRLENLRWGTPTDNSLDSVRNGRHHEAIKTHCKWGHEFTPENIKPQSSGNGRDCKTCANARTRAKRRGMTLQEYLKTETSNE